MITIKRTDSTDKDFLSLVSKLDKDLAIRNGITNDFYAQFNKVDKIKHAIVAFINDAAVGCGAIKEYDSSTMEIKRMFVPEKLRRQGIASMILKELETWSKECGYRKCILETGDKMPEALRLYYKNGFVQIPNFGPYTNVQNSICFEKIL
ncbi:MAG: GNAT family N-acetyltransferase [Bacteroidetes bacterium]|jgi:GNAT superfamily N-acetyltransferase|nr:GNAT family N-acetyltransferase [Bacteroidota bacterium]